MMPPRTIETPVDQQTIPARGSIFNRDWMMRLRADAKSIGWFMPGVALVMLLALALRLPNLSDRAIGAGEAYSYYFSNLSWSALWTETPFYGSHPPLYYSLLKIWTWITGDSEAGMRSLSVVASLATVGVIAFSSRLLGFASRYDRIGVMTAALLAINPGSIDYAQQASADALLTLFATLTILASAVLLKRLQIDDHDDAALKLAYLPAGIFAGVTLWLQHDSLFLIVGNWVGFTGAILLGSTHRRRDFIVSGKALAVVLLIWAPCIFIAWLESKPASGFSSPSNSLDTLLSPFTLASGGGFAFVLAGIVAVMAWLRIYKNSRAIAAYVASVVVIPVVFVFIASYVVSAIFVTGTMAWLTPVFLSVVSLGLFLPGKMQKLKFALAPILALICIGHDIGYYQSNTPDLRGATDYLSSRYQLGDLVMVYPNDLQLGLDYYARDNAGGMDVLALPATYPAAGLTRPYLQGNKGSPSVVESDRAQIRKLLAAHQRVWFVGKVTEPDNNMNIISSELYHAFGMPAQSADFVDTPVALFARR
ncbi:mannosyltransferase [Paraburkholderia sp. GAS199]|uniref:glycosyltransferase family 39 protein n=1 Tax=Paraburkholderia sp. GAS199 TaxID=3035126 RepID=UPI003D1BC0FC